MNLPFIKNQRKDFVPINVEKNIKRVMDLKRKE